MEAFEQRHNALEAALPDDRMDLGIPVRENAR
jgi:hypothetical protein